MAEAGSDSSNIGEEEKEQVARFEPLRSTGIHEILRMEGEAELARGLGPLVWTGLAAGLSMGFSFVTQALLDSGLSDAPWRHLVSSLGYSVGFVIIILGRQQLFTESTLTAVLPLLSRRDAVTAKSTLRLWCVVLAANTVGTWLFAAALAWGHPLPPDTGASLARLADEAVRTGFVATMFKGVFAGWLIALMVWLLPSASSAKLLVIVLLTYLVSLAGLPHIVAGSTEAAFAVLIGHHGAAEYLTGFFLPTLIGNTIGGTCLVALLNHAPIASEVAVDGG